MPPDLDTNMKFKFSILALFLEVVVIVLYGIFVDYDTNHGTNSSATELYPRKYFCLVLIEAGISLSWA